MKNILKLQRKELKMIKCNSMFCENEVKEHGDSCKRCELDKIDAKNKQKNKSLLNINKSSKEE